MRYVSFYTIKNKGAYANSYTAEKSFTTYNIIYKIQYDCSQKILNYKMHINYIKYEFYSEIEF